MTTTFKTKIRVVQQYKQPVHLKHVSQEETLKFYQDCSSLAEQPPAKHLPPMSTEWNVLPFALPVTEESPQISKTANEILIFSLKQQKEDEVSDNAGFVTIVVSRCLDSLGIVNKVDCGYRCIMDSSLPHMWLVIDGYVIDNTYIKELDVHSSKYLCKNTPKCYKGCDFSQVETPKMILKLHPKTDTLEIASAIMKTRLDYFIRNPDRALALGLNREQSFNYYFSMIRYMYERHGVSIVGIDPKIRSVCWRCDCYPKSGRPFLSDIVGPSDFKETDTSSKETWRFPHCSRCMVANYCSVKCQKADWQDNHIINCFSRGSVYLPPIGDIPFVHEPV